MTNVDKTESLIECIEGLWWQFGYQCLDGKGRHTGGLSDLEDAEAILLEHGRIKKYRKNGRMEWYVLTTE